MTKYSTRYQKSKGVRHSLIRKVKISEVLKPRVEEAWLLLPLLLLYSYTSTTSEPGSTESFSSCPWRDGRTIAGEQFDVFQCNLGLCDTPQ